MYAAVNTLVQEKELSDLLKSLDICSRCKVDAVILQDLGVARIIRESYPELEMHASTQMAVHNKEGALALQKEGFSRVVVARELTQGEIKEIAAVPGLETEAILTAVSVCFRRWKPDAAPTAANVYIPAGRILPAKPGKSIIFR